MKKKDSCQFKLISYYDSTEGGSIPYSLVRQDGRWVLTSHFIDAIIIPDAEWNY